MNQEPDDIYIYCEYPHNFCDNPGTEEFDGHWFCKDHKGWAENELRLAGAFITDGRS